MISKVGGRYQIVREIGSGAMGRVYQAVDTETGRAVAAKVLIAGEEVDLQMLLRFQQEGALLSTLKHPNIVQVYGTHLEEHISSIIMELLEGRSLAQLLREERLPLIRIKNLIVQTVSALAYAHSRGIVHRDIKPDNIMVIGDDHVKVTDFGIARVLQEGATLNTRTGTALGTPLYMSPEQIEGRSVDGRSDIYSLGAVMYQMVTGRPPFEGLDPLTVAFQHVHKAPPPPGEVNADVPGEWEALILRCLAKDPDNRFQSAGSLQETVEALPTAPQGVETAQARQPAVEDDGARAQRDAARAQTQDETRARLEQGKAQELQGELQSALRSYRAALTIAPQGPLRDELESSAARVSTKIESQPPASSTIAGNMDLPSAGAERPTGRDNRKRGAVIVGAALCMVVILAAVAYALTSRSSPQSAAPPTSRPAGQPAEHGGFAANLHRPGGLALDSQGNVYVADTGDNAIAKLSSSGKLLDRWGTRGSGAGQFADPVAVAIDAQGNLYVADSGNNRIVKLASSGDPISQHGGAENGQVQLKDPEGVAVDTHGNLYIADTGHNRILKLSSGGKLLTTLGAAQLSRPTGVAVDAQGELYVTDTGHNRVAIFSPSGTFLGAWGSKGSGAGQFNAPTGVSLDAQGNGYIADTGNNRVEEMASTGDPVAQWGSKGTGPHQFEGPEGVAVIGTAIYVADTGNDRIEKMARP